MLHRTTALILCFLLVWTTAPAAQRSISPDQIAKMSYLDLLEMESYPQLTKDQVELDR